MFCVFLFVLMLIS